MAAFVPELEQLDEIDVDIALLALQQALRSRLCGRRHLCLGKYIYDIGKLV